MAENVTGQLGNDQINLENAATESTLKLLLQATLATTKEQRKAVTDLVQKAGLDPEKVKEANTGLSGMSLTAAKVGATFAGLDAASNGLSKVFDKVSNITTSLASNSGKASDIFGQFSGMGGTIGLVATGFKKVAEYQEAALKSYQDLSNAGMNFGGSLSDLRLAAANSYMSLEKFTSMMAQNSETISKMGGSAESGIKAFSALSKELNQSGGVGDGLRALGFTSEQMNQSMITYIGLSGGRTKAEMSDRAALTKSAAGYMEQMDRLADITGKSREQQEKDLKLKMEEADIEQYKSTLSVKDREAFTAAMASANTLYGKAGTDLVVAAAQGRAVTGEAGQQLMALAPKAAGAISGFYSTIQKSGVDSKEALALENKSRVYNAQELKQFAGTVGTAGQVYKLIGDAAKQGAKDTMTGQDTLRSLDEAEIERAKAKKDRETSQAADAAKTQTALKELGILLTEKLIVPITDRLMPILNGLIQGFASVVTGMSKVPGLLEGLAIAVGLVTAYYVAQKAVMAVSAVKGGAGKVLDAVTGGGKAGGGGAGAAGGGMLKGLGSGIKGLGMSLASLGPQAPMIALGAAAVGAAIALIGAGIAGAAWLLGKALPTLAEGIASFAEIDGAALMSVGAGVAALGAGLAVFGAGGVMGSVGTLVSGLVDSLGGLVGVKSPVEKLKEFATLGPGLEQASNGLQAFTTNMNNLLNTDLSKISKLTAELQKLKEASTPAEKGILATASDLVKTAITSTAAPTEGGAKGAAGAGDMSEILAKELKALNKQTETLVKAMREAADSTAKTATLIAANGNLFRA